MLPAGTTALATIPSTAIGSAAASDPLVVVLRPAFVVEERGSHENRISRVSSERLAQLEKDLAGKVTFEELPFVLDEDLVVMGAIRDPRGPAGSALAERAAALAARSFGLDDATLLVLIPSDDDVVATPAAYFATTADAAQMLVIATPESTADAPRMVPSGHPHRQASLCGWSGGSGATTSSSPNRCARNAARSASALLS